MLGRKTIREFWPVDAQTFPEFLTLGIDPMRVPQPAFTLLDGHDPIACGGVLPLRPGLGEAWTILRQPANIYRFSVARAVKAVLERTFEDGRFRRIQTTILAGRPDLERWMAFLDFHLEGILCAYGANGEDHLMYARIRR